MTGYYRRHFEFLFLLSLILLTGVVYPHSNTGREQPSEVERDSFSNLLPHMVELGTLVILTADQEGVHERTRPIVIQNGRVISNDKTSPPKLDGKTLEIYEYMMHHPGSYGVREIQRIMGYSSSNLAYYHLNKLVDANVVKKDEHNQYRIEVDHNPIGDFRNMIQIKGVWIEKQIILAVVQFLVFLGALVGWMTELVRITLFSLMIVFFLQFIYFLKKAKES